MEKLLTVCNPILSINIEQSSSSLPRGIWVYFKRIYTDS